MKQTVSLENYFRFEEEERILRVEKYRTSLPKLWCRGDLSCPKSMTEANQADKKNMDAAVDPQTLWFEVIVLR